MKLPYTHKDVALFMKKQLDKDKILYQESVVYEIEKNFGSDFVYINENGNLAIDRNVLKEFRNITPDVVWERGGRCWRLREEFDHPISRMQE
jgi:argonaute-like protein implicated in RNA metabolism and viral defense